MTQNDNLTLALRALKKARRRIDAAICHDDPNTLIIWPRNGGTYDALVRDAQAAVTVANEYQVKVWSSTSDALEAVTFGVAGWSPTQISPGRRACHDRGKEVEFEYNPTIRNDRWPPAQESYAT